MAEHSLMQRGLLLVGEELVEGAGLTVATTTTSGNTPTAFIASNTAATGFSQAGDYWNDRGYYAELNADGVWRQVTDWVNTTATFTVATGFSTAPTASSSVILRVPILSAPLDTVEHGREFLERDITRKTLSKDGGVVAGDQPSFSFLNEIRGGNTAGNFTEWHTPLQSCGFVISGRTAGTAINYRPVSTAANQKSMVADLYLDGTKWTFAGCKGSFTLDNVAVNQIGQFNFSMQAMSVITTAAAIPATPPTYFGAALPPVINTTDFEYPDGTDLDIATYALSVENEITRVQATNATSGTRGLIITDRAITHTFNPEATNNTYLSNLQNNTIQAVDFTIGTVAGNKLKLRSPKAQLRVVTPEDDSGLRRFSVEGQANLSAAAGDDEISIRVF